MNFLAIDTSSVACSVALSLADEIAERHTELAREHTQLLVPMIEELLFEGDVSLSDLDAFVLGNGPGSFIGMRISASLVQGMAFGVSRPVVPVSSLLAVAEAAFADGDCDEVVVAQDAHMNEVYLGRFGRADSGEITALAPETLHSLSVIDGLGADGLGASARRLAAGAGWERYPALWTANADAFAELSSHKAPRARHLFPCAKTSFDAGLGIDPADIEPSYLRQKVATPPSGP